MNAQTLFFVIIAILAGQYLLDLWLEMLNKKNWCATLPESLIGVYDEAKFEQHRHYRAVNHRFGLVYGFWGMAIMLAFLLSGGFAWLDGWVRSCTDQPILQSLLFFGVILVGNNLLDLPFSYYQTFVVEGRFGFNKTTPKTFVLDILKSAMLAIVLGIPLLALVVWFHLEAGAWFWLYTLMAIGAFMLLMNLFYTSWILPLFNRLTPLPEGELRQAIEQYSRTIGFKMGDIYLMDGSRRSTKANAFFSGFGPRKKIVLFDTLVNDLSTQEVVAVLAHEVGHYRLKHTLWGLVASLLQMANILFLLGLVVNSPLMTQAVGVSEPSFHIGLTVFGMIYTPVSLVASLLMNWLSRRNEFAADAFAGKTYSAGWLASALKKISVKALSNPTPHPAYVFFHYSHPPLLQRLEALEPAMSTVIYENHGC